MATKNTKPGNRDTNKVEGPASYFPSIERKYGRSIAYWKELIAASERTKHMDLVAWLKSEPVIGHGHANSLVADTFRNGR